MNEQQQEQYVNSLKLRCFDMQEAFAAIEREVKMLRDAISQIIEVTGCSKDDLTIEDVVNAVKELKTQPEQEVAE